MLTAFVYAAAAVSVAAILGGTGIACALLAGRTPAPEGFDQHADRALAVTQPPAAAHTAPAPAPPPGVPPPARPTPARCSLCGWNRVYRPCCGWVLVPEICPAHQPDRTTP